MKRSHRTPVTGPGHRSRHTQRHGMAMLLVLISLMMATILTVAYVSSRDNSVAIGENVAEASAARWAASSGIEVAVSILETQTSWRTSHIDGRLVSDMNIAGASLDIDLIDLKTGAPPTADSNDIRIIATATLGSIEQMATANAFVSTTADGKVDVDLSEFAAFGKAGIEVTDNATIAAWSASPRSAFGGPMKIGTHATSAGRIRLDSSRAPIDPVVYQRDGASNFLVTDPDAKRNSLLDPIPVPSAPTVSVTEDDEGADLNPDLDSNGDVVVGSDTEFDDVQLRTSTGVMTVQGETTIVIHDDLFLDSNAGILVDGNVKLVVHDNLVLNSGSYIELRPGATLQMFLGSAMTATDAYIGDERADKSQLDTDGTASYMDTERLIIYGMQPADALTSSWTFNGRSVAKSNIYAPYSNVVLDNQATLYGRVASHTLRARDQSSVYYDPTLDERRGYTNPKSLLYDQDGRIRSSLLSLATLDESAIQAVAESEELAIEIGKSLLGTVRTLVDADSVDADDPTPRPIPVQFSLLSTGSDIVDWEDTFTGP